MSLRILIPVVEKPDIDSKNASVKLSTSPLKINGNAPIKDIAIQLKVTDMNPSLLPLLSLFLYVDKNNDIPIVAVIIQLYKKGMVSDS